ncbi:MAG: hypothetical protein J2P15_06780 [Micromonosporaceae bacterium]|nr:hypothetical protein [Micromonosporaceae bacterium]
MGTLMTLDLPAGAPALTMPWIITFGPLDDDEEWEPVVVGPYEREHALALAEEIVSADDLMAVVEPVLPHTSVQDIRAEIAVAIAAGEAIEEEVLDGEPGADGIDAATAAASDVDGETAEPAGSAGPPSPEEIRAGFARIAARLTVPQ